jgi:hypothetical protein
MADAADAGAEAYGAGIFEAGDGHLGHGSEAPGHLAYIFVSADRSTAIAVACNGDRGGQSAIQQLARALRTAWAR